MRIQTAQIPWAAARLLAFAALFLAAPAAEAGDVTAFVAFPTPREVWGSGYGAALSSTWFQVVSFEGEVARVAGEGVDESMTSFTGSALLAPPIGVLTPYGGLGIGFFRQSAGSRSDTGTLHCFVLGVKLKLAHLLVVKGEYRSLDLSGTPLLVVERRFSLGAGISF